ncbi:hypothetical protein SISNIDRAFT_481904 [Sistotremastrum niveocremeum HHB9708]|uniref:1-alkyl-2-acetylglycerophosphocholine esterase n=1 Tax=Sistotremastrum niveocremeum HHB9708 TaxID=1314777 RepID=A0A164ZT98_9AGAM|nr:hypothetical protein SISNIDRAFT_481904 [Sistotremastrum niveocremeum HHB9708]
MLPGYSGPFEVGCATFAAPLPSVSVGDGSLSNGDPILQTEEATFNVFYPAQISPKATKGVYWVVRPLRDAALGFAKYTGISWLILWFLGIVYAQFIKIPVYANVPLLKPPVKLDASESGGRWPLVIFSHGLGGGRNIHYCAQLASEGHVVLAIEHKDGSGSSCLNRRNGKLQHLVYVKADEVQWKTKSKLTLRQHQLLFRVREIYEIYAIFRRFVASVENREILALSDGIKISYEWKSWENTVNVDEVVLAAHSFGGATVLSLLSSPPPPGHQELSIKKVILLDPWLDPLPSPGPLPTHTGDFELLILNSEGFTLMKEHFERLVDLISAWRNAMKEAQFFTLARAAHVSFSDVVLVKPRAGKEPIAMLALMHTLSLAFLRESIPSAIDSLRAEGKVKPMKILRTNKRVLFAEEGDIIVH